MSKDLNLLQNKDFQFSIERLPQVSYFCAAVSIPAVTGNYAYIPSPFTQVKVPGDTLNYNPLTITFRVDRDLHNYEEILKWMESYGTPESFSQYLESEKYKDPVKAKVSDASLITSTNKYNPNILFTFEDVFPTDISEITLDTTQTDVPVILCTVSFAYTKFKLIRP